MTTLVIDWAAVARAVGSPPAPDAVRFALSVCPSAVQYCGRAAVQIGRLPSVTELPSGSAVRTLSGTLKVSPNSITLEA